MRHWSGSEDTICALATPPGTGGISVVRVSGPKAKEFVSLGFSFSSQPESHRIYFGNFLNPEGDILDEVLVSFFQNGKSFTGEETLEISCHGSVFIVDQIIQSLIYYGCRLAARGEFSFRAFMNGRIDLVQAESILSIIESQSKLAHQASIHQLKGVLSSRIKEIQQELQFCLAHIEANIDFSLENLETIDTAETVSRLKASHERAKNLLDTFSIGKTLSENFRIILVGAPNAGKSSLFNALLEKDRAIVTSEEGTTRDVLFDNKIHKGLQIQFMDTAGMRDAQSAVEKIGIQRAREELVAADLIIYVFDLNKSLEIEEEIFEKHKNKIILVGNKIDLVEKPLAYSPTEQINNVPCVCVSAHNQKSLEPLWEAIEKRLVTSHVDLSSVVIKQRHFELLKILCENIQKTYTALEGEISSEFAATELRGALSNTYEILGEQFDDQVLAKIFQEFCIGK